MKRFIFVFILFATLSTQSFAIQYVSEGCKKKGNFLNQVWLDLSLQEPMLRPAYQKTVEQSGTSNVFNCRVSWPEKFQGQPSEGLRVAILDQQFYQNQIFYHHGYRIKYWLRTIPDTFDPSIVYVQRILTGFEVCRTAETCKAMGIPISDTSVIKPYETKIPEVIAAMNFQSISTRPDGTPEPIGGSPGWKPKKGTLIKIRQGSIPKY